MRVQARADAVQEGDGTETGVGRYSASHGVTQLAPDDPEQDARHGAREIRVP